MRWMMAFLAMGLVACGGQNDVEYDPNWGNDQFVPAGKADLVDLAPPLVFGVEASGSVDERSLDVFKIDLARGDKIRITKRVTAGDLAPDASLFFATGGAIRSADFSAQPAKLTKDYVIDGTATYLVAVRAFRNQGAGKYTLVVECTGGTCAGELPEPDPDLALSTSEIGDCIADARVCAMEDLKRFNGAVGQARASTSFNTCLARGTAAESCQTACDADPEASGLCQDIVKSLTFYADQPQACLDVLEGCMDSCMDSSSSWDDEFWSQPISICWQTGFNGNCDSFARGNAVCGGRLTDEDAICRESCQSTFGAWNDDLDTVCSDDCNRCGITCGEQLEWYTIPENGLSGEVREVFAGEMDPVVVGDVCVVVVEVVSEDHGQWAPGLYGLVDDSMAGCDRLSEDAVVHVGPLEAVAIEDRNALDVLKAWRDDATYLQWTGTIERLN